MDARTDPGHVSWMTDTAWEMSRCQRWASERKSKEEGGGEGSRTEGMTVGEAFLAVLLDTECRHLRREYTGADPLQTTALYMGETVCDVPGEDGVDGDELRGQRRGQQDREVVEGRLTGVICERRRG